MATGHIRKRESKSGKISYQIIIEAGKPDPKTNKRQRIYETVNGTKKQAQQLLQMRLRQMDSGNYVGDCSILLKDFVDDWLESKKNTLKVSTLNRYKEQIDWYILPYLGRYPLSSLSAPIIQKWVNEVYANPPTKKNQHKSLSPKTVRNIFLNLSAMLDYAKANKMISSNPCELVSLPKIEKKELEVYSVEELNTILSCAKDTDLFFPVFLLIHTGMRRGELLGLKWKNVHLDDGIIEITETKLQSEGKVYFDTPKSKNSRRKIPIDYVVVSEFRKYRVRNEQIMLKQGKRVSQDDCVICRSDGTFYDPDDFLRLWRRFLEKNNIRYLKLHALRHNFATLLLMSNVDAKTIGDLMGHSDSTLVLTTYGHSLEETKKEAVGKIDSLISVS